MVCNRREASNRRDKKNKKRYSPPYKRKTKNKRRYSNPYMCKTAPSHIEPTQSMKCTMVLGPSIKTTWSNQKRCTKKRL